MLTGAPDLDDVAALTDADVEGLLPASALAGAQVRAVVAAREEGALEPVRHLRPRAVVVVCGDGTAGRATDLVLALVGPHIDVPLIKTAAMPSWIGPLDVVVVAGDDAGDPRLAEAASRAGRRQAEVVIAGPLEGPLRESLGGPVLDMSPRIRVRERFRFAHYVSVLVAVLDSLDAVRMSGERAKLPELADELDREAAGNHPGNEMFHNAAKELAARVVGRPTVWTAETPAGMAVASHAARTFFASAGSIGVATDVHDVVAAGPLLHRTESSVDYDPIFHDAQIDGPAAEPVRVQVLTTPDREWLARRLTATLPEVDIQISGPAAAPTGQAPPSGPPGLGDLVPLMILALRADMAGAYLRLVGER
ncbi:MAG: hypothetical protein C0482_23405 [Gordonia sp.]|nr:hypothetical protein [Gordonia sp. (in: high G+C Gram-positive bacteria)]